MNTCSHQLRSALTVNRLLIRNFSVFNTSLLGDIAHDVVGVMGVLDTHQITTLLNVVLTTELRIHLLKQRLARFRNAEVYEDSEQKIDAGEHVEGVEAAVLFQWSAKVYSLMEGNTLAELTSKNVGKNCCTIELTTFCVCDAMPTA